MLFVIEGRKYPANSLQDISLIDMLAVKRQTGMNLEQLDAALGGLKETEGGGLDIAGLDEAAILALATLIWLARRQAGERDLTIEQAADFPLLQLEMEAEPGDEPDAAPNRPARRARAAKKAPAAKRTPATGGRTRTSKTPSGPA